MAAGVVAEVGGPGGIGFVVRVGTVLSCTGKEEEQGEAKRRGEGSEGAGRHLQGGLNRGRDDAPTVANSGLERNHEPPSAIVSRF